MKNTTVGMLTVLALASAPGLAKEQHGAHEHGKAELNVAIDGMNVMIAFESPADSIYGFEHEAKAAKDIATRDDAAKILKENASSLFQFQADRGCALTTSSIDPWVKEGADDHDHHDAKKAPSAKGKKESGHKQKHDHGNHGEVHANYTFTCTKSPASSKLTVTLIDTFPKLREIAVQLISDQKQSGSTLKSSNKTLDL